jgi:hypothetical protein
MIALSGTSSSCYDLCGGGTLQFVIARVAIAPRNDSENPDRKNTAGKVHWLSSPA